MSPGIDSAGRTNNQESREQHLLKAIRKMIRLDQLAIASLALCIVGGLALFAGLVLVEMHSR